MCRLLCPRRSVYCCCCSSGSNLHTGTCVHWTTVAVDHLSTQPLQGLLHEAVDDVLDSLNTPAIRPAAVQQVLAKVGLRQQHSSSKSCDNRSRQGHTRQSNAPAAPGCSSRQPLASRITVKETAILLELLQGEDPQQQACGDDRRPHNRWAYLYRICIHD